MRIVSEPEFAEMIALKLGGLPRGYFKSVTGPGRSGAVAAVYASHILGIPFKPHKLGAPLFPVLVVDAASESGCTLKRAVGWYARKGPAHGIAIFHEPPRVCFWYEKRKIIGDREYIREWELAPNG